jgi:hypothetical protein
MVTRVGAGAAWLKLSCASIAIALSAAVGASWHLRKRLAKAEMTVMKYLSFRLGNPGIDRSEAARLHIKLAPIKKVKFSAAHRKEKRLTLKGPGLKREKNPEVYF